MKYSFLYSGPHYTHSTWAESVDSYFIRNRIENYRVKNLSRLMKSLLIIKKIPKDTDVLICEGGSDIIAGYIWKRNNNNKKLVFIVDDPKVYYLSRMNKIKQRLYYKALDSVDLFIAPTELMKSYIPKKYYPKTRIAELWIDYKKFYSKNDINSKNIVFVGLLCKEKGVDRIIRAFKKVNSKIAESKLYLVGDGPLRGESKDNIFFVGHSKSPEKYMRKGSIYINLARLEPAGVAVLEAMSCGLPPIITDHVGFKYAVDKVSKDLTVKDEEEAAEMIIKLWNDKKLLKSLSEKSRIAPEKFTKERSIKMFKNALKLIE